MEQMDIPFLNNSKTVLQNIIDWVNVGDYIILYYTDGTNGISRLFHKNCNNNDNDIILKNNRFIYINLNNFPNLLNKGEWDYYIINENNNISECTCNIVDEICNLSQNIIYKYYFTI